ncbi:MAG: ABC transporter ATP-binding protein [Verrucomicrobiales bacterium]|nr:ABC transporter ATP-binding protein [Verrucomicrobiales bacterium]
MTMDALSEGPTPSPRENPAVLRTQGLRRSFGRVRAVEDLNLTVPAGGVYGFLGMNGAGKTTTIRMLMGILKPDAGHIEMLGESTPRTSIRQKQCIGYVSQEQNFYPWMTAIDLGRFVGALYPTWDAAEFQRLLRVLDVPDDRRVSQLSGGTKVKLALALALAPRPALLLLDEPTAGLDPVARREFSDAIRQQARHQGRTTFFSSHLIDEVERVADRIGIIHHGRLLFEGDLSSLRSEVRLLRRPGEAGTPWVLPPGLTLLRQWTEGDETRGVARGAPDSWSASVPAVGNSEEIPLEEIFLAMVGISPSDM